MRLVARAHAPASRVRATLAEPSAYRRALPELVRFAPVGESWQPGARAPHRLIAWELEIPLWNLAGRLWLRATAAGVELTVADGDLAPGRFVVRAQDDREAPLVFVEGHANVRDANFVTRRLAKRDPRAETAMNATAAFVALRALLLEAEGATATPRRRPAAAATPPAALPEQPLAAEVLALLDPPRVDAVAAIRLRADGRLDHVEVAAVVEAPVQVAGARLREPARWQALPGWRHVELDGSAWKVAASFPFVDFDARWSVAVGPPLGARAEAGAVAGALIRADVVPPSLSPVGTATRSVLRLLRYPRLERTGFIPRRLVEAEPLLEPALALALAYAEATALARALAGP